MRTLTYKDIKAGRKKAGMLPEANAEPIVMLAWLSAAGYGKACLPSLVEYLYLKKALKSGDFRGWRPRRARRSRYDFSRQVVVKLMQKWFGVEGEFPKSKNPRKAQRRVKNFTPFCLERFLENRREQHKCLRKHGRVLFIMGAVKAHDGLVSGCHIDWRRENRPVLVIPTKHGRVVFEDMSGLIARQRYGEEPIPGFGAVPLPLP